ncbi:MAG: CBS domain-containing protein [Gaiellaceae bacterium]|nr:CBS domain-containing protein [Gaiellaceae bacterium]
MRVSELMTEDVVTVRPEISLRDAAALLAERRISGVPVVDDEGRVVGVLSEADIVAKAGGPRHGHRLLGWLFEPDLDLGDKIAARTVGEAMSVPPVTIEAERRVHEAARIMASEGINRLPVVSAEGKLVGIVTRADVVRAFARSDAEIAREIEHEILQRTLWLEPGSVTVAVVDGVVTLRGEVESEADAELLPVFVSRVPGVVEVRSDVRPRETTPAA